MFISNHSLFSIQCHGVQGCLHPWMQSSGLQTQRCHLNPVCHGMMMLGILNMDMDMDIVHVVMNVHEYIDVCQGFPPYPNVHHQVGTVWKSSSSSSSSASRVTYAFKVYLEDGH